MSHPSRDAWIEMPSRRPAYPSLKRRIPRGMRGLKFAHFAESGNLIESHPSRDAWIEIAGSTLKSPEFDVASLAGCVD